MQKPLEFSGLVTFGETGQLLQLLLKLPDCIKCSVFGTLPQSSCFFVQARMGPQSVSVTFLLRQATKFPLDCATSFSLETQETDFSCRLRHIPEQNVPSTWRIGPIVSYRTLPSNLTKVFNFYIPSDLITVFCLYC